MCPGLTENAKMFVFLPYLQSPEKWLGQVWQSAESTVCRVHVHVGRHHNKAIILFIYYMLILKDSCGRFWPFQHLEESFLLAMGYDSLQWESDVLAES